MPKVFVSFGKMLTLMLVDKAESSIWKFNVNGIKKYLHSGFYFNFENTLLLSDIKYFWINHILNRSNFWGLVIFWTMYVTRIVLSILLCQAYFISLRRSRRSLVKMLFAILHESIFQLFFHLMVFPTFRTLVHWPLILLNTSTKNIYSP